MSIYIFGCRIYLDSSPTVANASDIGLYDDADNGVNKVFRWIDTDISSYSPTYTWKTGVLKPSPFKEIIENVDLTYGGNLPSVGGNSVKITNTISYGGSFTQFDKILDSNSIRLTGLRCDIVRFEVSSGTLTSADGDIVFRGICGDIEWIEKVLIIPLETALLKRKSNLATVVDSDSYPNATSEIIGNTIPITFGEFVPEFADNGNPTWNGYAKFVRTANSEENFTVINGLNYYDFSDGAYQTFLNVSFGSNITDGKEFKMFPVVGDDGDDPPIMYKIEITSGAAAWATWNGSTFVPQTSGVLSLNNIFENSYIKSVKGAGLNTYRKIESARVDIDTDDTIIELTISDYFEENLEGNATATADNQTWIEIIDIDRKYSADVWPCKDYLNTSGVKVNTDLNLYSFVSISKAKVTTENTDANISESQLQFYRLPDYAYEDSGNGNKNEITIDVKLFNETPDNMDSFTIKPIENFKLNDSETLEEWAVSTSDNGTHGWSLYNKDQNGLYFKSPDIPDPMNIDKSLAYVSKVTDRLSYTRYWISAIQSTSLAHPGFDIRYMFSFIFDLPASPIDFDDVYLVLNYNSGASTTGTLIDSYLFVRYKYFTGYASEISTTYNSLNYWDGVIGGGVSRSDPDFYYINQPDNKNKYFYVDSEVNTPEDNLWGYKKLHFNGVNSKEVYDNITKASINAYHKWVDTEYRFATSYSIYQIAVAFKKQISIKDAIYSPFKGRVYGAKWGQATGSSSSSSSSSSQSSPSESSSSSSQSQSSSSSSQSSPSSSSSSSESCVLGVGRKNACALINNPIDVYEHVMRLQNWSEQDEIKNWGKEYADVPLIDISTSEGGFDYADLDSIKNIPIARQILEEKDADSNVIAKSLCKAFFLCGYQNPTTGNESISYIVDKSLSDPVTTITLSDIIGDIGVVKTPITKGIFCEPFVRYAKNNATGEYDKIIRITNTDADVYDSSYVTGISGSGAEFLWLKANVLRQAYRQVQTPPADMTDNDWIYRDIDAENYLDSWLSWMGAVNTDGTRSGVELEPKRRISFTVPYEIGKDWFLTKHIKLQLPHQTDNTAIECIIEKLTKNISKGEEYVSVNVILYGASSEIALYIQDTYGTTDPDWQDSYQTQAEQPSQEADVQDAY